MRDILIFYAWLLMAPLNVVLLVKSHSLTPLLSGLTTGKVLLIDGLKPFQHRTNIGISVIFLFLFHLDLKQLF